MAAPESIPGLPGANDRVAAASYRARLLTGGSIATRFSHRGRVGRSRSILGERTFDLAADAGAADGWYLRELLQSGTARRGVAIEIDPAMNAVGAERSVGMDLEFFEPGDPQLSAFTGRCDLVTCLETLEHVDDPAAVIAHVFELARPGGTVLVSVPIEVGPSVLAKQTGRWLANRKGDYRYERYTARELVDASVRWRPPRTRVNLHSHKGFDYRAIEPLLEAGAYQIRREFSPFPLAGKVLASTVFWLIETPPAP